MAVVLCALYHQREYKSGGGSLLGLVEAVERCWVWLNGTRGVVLDEFVAPWSVCQKGCTVGLLFTQSNRHR